MTQTDSVMQALANELAKATHMPTADELIQPAGATPPRTDSGVTPIWPYCDACHERPADGPDNLCHRCRAKATPETTTFTALERTTNPDHEATTMPDETATRPMMNDTGTNWSQAVDIQNCRIAAANMTVAELLEELNERWNDMQRSSLHDGRPPADYLLRLAETARRAAQATDECQYQTIIGNKLLLASRSTDMRRGP